MELKGPLCYVLDYDDIANYAYQTALKIKRSGWRPDAVVGIARGGWVQAQAVGAFLPDGLLDPRRGRVGVLVRVELENLLSFPGLEAGDVRLES